MDPAITTYRTTGTELLTTTIFHTIPISVTTIVKVRGRTCVTIMAQPIFHLRVDRYSLAM